MTGLPLETLLHKMIDAWKDDDKVQTVLPAYFELLEEILENQQTLAAPTSFGPVIQPAVQPPYHVTSQPAPVVDMNQVRDPGSRDFILDPTNGNSKAMRGKRKRGGGERFQKGSGAGYEDPEIPLE